jgi:hypothetical protein
MLEEHILSRNLEELVMTMQSRKKTHLVPFLFQKVISLQEAFEQAKDQFDLLKTAKIDEKANIFGKTTPKLRFIASAEQKLKSQVLENRDEMVRILKEILAARQLRDMESQTSRLLEYRIVKAWDRIKGVRIAQGFSSTDIKLYIKTALAEKVDYRKEAEMEVYFKKKLWELKRIKMSDGVFNSTSQDELTEDTDNLLSQKKKGNLSSFIGQSVVHLDAFHEKKVKENATRRLKSCYPLQPELEFRIDFTHKITANIDCPHVSVFKIIILTIY